MSSRRLNPFVDPTAEKNAPQQDSEESIPLPDIKQVLQKKAMEQLARAEEEEKRDSQVKINRKDKDALAKVCVVVLYVDSSLLLHVENKCLTFI